MYSLCFAQTTSIEQSESDRTCDFSRPIVIFRMAQTESKLGFSATWSMAVGGMVGGGIFSTLGVVVGIAGPWAWLSFAAAGLIGRAAGYSYVRLEASRSFSSGSN